MKVLQVIFTAPRELRKAELERGIIARRDLEHLHSGTHDLGTYAVAPNHPDLDHSVMLAIGGEHFSKSALQHFSFLAEGSPCVKSQAALQDAVLAFRSCGDERVS